MIYWSKWQKPCEIHNLLRPPVNCSWIITCGIEIDRKCVVGGQCDPHKLEWMLMRCNNVNYFWINQICTPNSCYFRWCCKMLAHLLVVILSRKSWECISLCIAYIKPLPCWEKSVHNAKIEMTDKCAQCFIRALSTIFCRFALNTDCGNFMRAQ